MEISAEPDHRNVWRCWPISNTAEWNNPCDGLTAYKRTDESSEALASGRDCTVPFTGSGEGWPEVMTEEDKSIDSRITMSSLNTGGSPFPGKIKDIYTITNLFAENVNSFS
ncbi:hypothetical protein D3C73_1286520 [compost metagenome]